MNKTKEEILEQQLEQLRASRKQFGEVLSRLNPQAPASAKDKLWNAATPIVKELVENRIAGQPWDQTNAKIYVFEAVMKAILGPGFEKELERF